MTLGPGHAVIDVLPSDDVAAAGWIGPRLHPFKSFDAGSFIPTGFEAYSRIDHERTGTIPPDLASVLVSILAARTAPPGECWMALWNGYGWLGGRGSRSYAFLSASAPLAEVQPAPQIPVTWHHPPLPGPSAKLVKHPNREYFLYRGSIEKVAGWMDGPNLWWPEDRSWCVASEIDLPWTYVGGSKALIDEVLAEPALGARRVSLDESTAAADQA